MRACSSVLLVCSLAACCFSAHSAEAKVAQATPEKPAVPEKEKPAVPKATPEKPAVPEKATPEKPAVPEKEKSLMDLSISACLQRLTDNAERLVHASANQAVAAGLAMVMGMAMLFDGSKVFRFVVTGIFAVLVYSMTLIAVQSIFDEWDTIWCQIASVEVGLFFALTTFLVWDPFRYFLGAVFGGIIAHGILAILEEYQEDWTRDAHPLAFILLWTVMVGWGMVLMWSDKHKGVLAIVSPLFGAMLFVSAGSYFLVWSTINGPLKGSDPFGIVPDCDGECIFLDFWNLLVSNVSKDVGFFKNSTSNVAIKGNEYLSEMFCWDRVLERLWCLIFFACSACFQWKRHGVEQAAKSNPLTEPLMSEEK